MSIFGKIKKGFKKIKKRVKKVAKGVTKGVSKAVNVVGKVKDIAEDVTETITDPFEGAIRGVKRGLKSIDPGIGNIVDKVGDIAAKATDIGYIADKAGDLVCGGNKTCNMVVDNGLEILGRTADLALTGGQIQAAHETIETARDVAKGDLSGIADRFAEEALDYATGGVSSAVKDIAEKTGVDLKKAQQMLDQGVKFVDRTQEVIDKANGYVSDYTDHAMRVADSALNDQIRSFGVNYQNVNDIVRDTVPVSEIASENRQFIQRTAKMEAEIQRLMKLNNAQHIRDLNPALQDRVGEVQSYMRFGNDYAFQQMREKINEGFQPGLSYRDNLLKELEFFNRKTNLQEERERMTGRFDQQIAERNQYESPYTSVYDQYKQNNAQIREMVNDLNQIEAFIQKNTNRD